MSFSGAEFAGETAFDSVFTTPAGHRGITFLASTGDGGSIPQSYGDTVAGYPALFTERIQQPAERRP